MAEGECGRVKVFCSYRSVDREAVGKFAARLRAGGVDAWFDTWEVAPGDDIVAKMDAGVDGCEAALIFVSGAWFDGKWARDEYTSLIYRQVEQGIRVIPVMLEDVAERLPSRLGKLARRSVEDFDEIRDTLLGVDRKPGVATALEAFSRAVTVELRERDGSVCAALVVDGEPQAQGGGAPYAGLSLRDDEVGRVVFPGEVGVALDRLLDGLGAATVADVRFVAPGSLGSLPLEAALLPSGRALGPGQE